MSSALDTRGIKLGRGESCRSGEATSKLDGAAWSRPVGVMNPAGGVAGGDNTGEGSLLSRPLLARVGSSQGGPDTDADTTTRSGMEESLNDLLT